MIRFERVGFHYGKTPVLTGLSLHLEKGTGAALFGPNGAGKSTLLRLAMALLHPPEGRVTTAGIATQGKGPEDLAGQVGFLFQRPEDQLIARSVRSEVAYGPRQAGWSTGRVAQAVDRVLAECRLTELADVHPYDLPLPIRRMVAMASVLVTDPAVILLDEPTALLDRPTRAVMAELVRSRVERGATVLAVVHDPIFAIEALDRAISLERGQVVADGTVEEVLRKGTAGLSLPMTVQAAEGAGIRGASLRMKDLATALRARVGGSERA
jgi:energy-coupling factor transporter ATP-binding protein EcfA2